MHKFLVLNYAGSRPQSDKAWDKFFVIAQQSGKFVGGSALGERKGYSEKGFQEVEAKTVVGYFIFKAEDEAEVAEILKSCPIISSGGSFDIIKLKMG